MLPVSLYSSNVGEAIGIVYGYTKEGDLLVADENLNPVGTLKITECAMNMMDKDGNIGPKHGLHFVAWDLILQNTVTESVSLLLQLPVQMIMQRLHP